MEFDIDDLDKEVRASLLRQIDEASREYGAHKQRVVDEVRIVQELNNGMKGLHSKTVEARNELNHDISQAMHKCKQNLSIIEHQNGEKQRLRLKLLEMQSKLRKMELNIESAQIENTNLRNVQVQEADLRLSRD